jgi:hypothetical protein
MPGPADDPTADGYLLLSEEFLAELAQDAVDYARSLGAAEAMAIASDSGGMTMRVSNGRIETARRDGTQSLAITVYDAQRTGRASTRACSSSASSNSRCSICCSMAGRARSIRWPSSRRRATRWRWSGRSHGIASRIRSITSSRGAMPGYYSYLWAEVLAADGFRRFAEAGLVDRATGDLFRDAVLSRGSTRPAAESFRAFRGRDPDSAAFLARHGLS